MPEMYLYFHTELNEGFDPNCVASSNISKKNKSADLQLNLGKITVVSLCQVFEKMSWHC